MNVSNRLSEDVKIIGTLISKEDLFIDCELEGEITSSGSLTIGENAKLKGEIHAANIVVFGNVEGNLSSKTKCELKETAEINGNIEATTLRVVEGAVFNGRAQVTKSSQSSSTQDSLSSQPDRQIEDEMDLDEVDPDEDVELDS